MNRRRPHRAVAAALLCALAAALGCVPSAQAETSGEQTVFTPTSGAGFVDPGAMYARAVTLYHNGDAITQTAAVGGDSNQVWTLANAVSWTELDSSDQLWTVRRIDTD